MRKLRYFLILALLTFVVSPAFALNDTTLDDVVRLKGDGARQGSAVRVLKLVRYDESGQNGTGVSSGDALVLSLLSDDGVTVDRSAASHDQAFVGIAAMTIQTSDATTGTSAYDDVGRRNWGWMIVHGPANAKVSAGGTNGHSAGTPFVTSTDAAAVTGLQTVNVALTADVIGQSTSTGGIFLDAASASATDAEVYVELM